MVICVDLDGVLTLETEGWDYANRTPRISMLHKIRQWYRDGSHIILYSARLKIDRKITTVWLKKYHVPYHELILGKPRADLYIDDKAMRPEEVL
jgi:capsule biosynthesis phosphatase